MPIYHYKGIRGDGKSMTGIIDADSIKGARFKLRKGDVYPTEVSETNAFGRMPAAAHVGRPTPRVIRLSLQDVSNLTRQVATLLTAGIPLVEALGVLIDQSETKALRPLLTEIREHIREGTSLSTALENHPRIFSPVYVHMVRAGEASGSLDHILARLADFLEAQVTLKHKVTNAALYPALMLVVSVGVLFFLMTFVIPKITAVFTDVRQALPWPTLFLMHLSHFFAAYWWLLACGLALLVVGAHRIRRTPAGRVLIDRLALKAPILGVLIRKVALARLTGTLATMLASGVHLLDALDVSKRVMNNAVLEEAVESARRNIREGESIAEPLKRSGEVPSLVTHMISVGEKSGELEELLLRVSHIYTRDVDRLTTRLVSLLEPIMIMVMGGIVFFIVLAILFPIFQMSQMAR